MEFSHYTFRTLFKMFFSRISIIVTFYIILCHSILAVTSVNTSIDCSSVKNIFQDKGINLTEVPKSPLSGKKTVHVLNFKKDLLMLAFAHWII